MALDVSGVVAGQIIRAAHITQFYNLLVGTMTDQAVTLKNKLTLTRVAASSPSELTYLQVTGVADTNVSGEATDVSINLARTLQFTAASVPSTQRAINIGVPTYSATGAAVIATAATLTVDGAPAAGTNMTLTNAYALWVRNAGRSFLEGPVTISAGSTTSGIHPLRITQSVASSGTPSAALRVDGATHTGLANAVEAIDVDLVLARTVTFAGGLATLGEQRAVRIQGATYAATAAGPLTITNAATLSVDQPGAAGANVAITDRWAVMANGRVKVVGQANTEHLVIQQNATQTAAPFEVRNSGGTAHYQIAPSGGTNVGFVVGSGPTGTRVGFHVLQTGAGTGYFAGVAGDVGWYRTTNAGNPIWGSDVGVQIAAGTGFHALSNNATGGYYGGAASDVQLYRSTQNSVPLWRTDQVLVIGGADPGGSGAASTITLTRTFDESLGAGAGTVLMKTGNPGNSSGWLKFYAGANARYIPYWTNISP